MPFGNPARAPASPNEYKRRPLIVPLSNLNPLANLEPNRRTVWNLVRRMRDHKPHAKQDVSQRRMNATRQSSNSRILPVQSPLAGLKTDAGLGPVAKEASAGARVRESKQPPSGRTIDEPRSTSSNRAEPYRDRAVRPREFTPIKTGMNYLPSNCSSRTSARQLRRTPPTLNRSEHSCSGGREWWIRRVAQVSSASSTAMKAEVSS